MDELRHLRDKVAVIGVGLWLLQPVFDAIGDYSLIFFFVVLVLGLVLAAAFLPDFGAWTAGQAVLHHHHFH